jgi:molybdopterin-containing oxidoreductase family membrane subunit
LAWAIFAWGYQLKTGLGVAGINHPVGWGIYITNFVFWVGIAHSGTLISAVLFLLRCRWRNSIARSAEAMTIFAVMTVPSFIWDVPGIFTNCCRIRRRGSCG